MSLRQHTIPIPFNNELPPGRSHRPCRRAEAWCSFLVLAAWLIVSPRLLAQNGTIDKRLVLTVQPTHGVARGHAPLSLTATLRWMTPELIEGVVQLDWYVDTTRLGRYVSPELALAESTINLSVMVPPIILPHDDAVVSVQGRFITDTDVYDLDIHDIALQPDWRRILLVGVCGSARQLPPEVHELEIGQRQNVLLDAFDLEPFFASRFLNRELLVDDVDVAPEDVPTDPLKLTAFDVFVVPAESLAKLKLRQLDCLLAWVRGGGSLCVIVDSIVPRTHVDWLNRIAGGDAAEAAYLQDADGGVVATAESDGRLRLCPLDLGRTVVAVGPPDFDGDEWKQAALFLWKVRADHRQAAKQKRPWRVEQAEFRGSYQQYARLEPQRLWPQAMLAQCLLPKSIRGLPMKTVGLVLVLFLLVIAPGDYFLLGWLKRRRWTWILFPTVSLLFTGYTMWLAREHLGRTAYDHSITVIDVGCDGRPVRTSRFEVLFVPGNRTETSNRTDAMMVPLDPELQPMGPNLQPPWGPQQYEDPWVFAGRVPQHYTVHRDVQQWSPRMARTTMFHATGRTGLDPMMPDDDASTVETTETDDVLDAELIFDPNGPAATVKRFHQNVVEVLRVDPALPSFIIQLAESMTRRPESGFFSVVSQLSPTTAGNWEDLALLDASDARQSVTVAVTHPAEGQFVIYRRLDWEQE